MIKTFVRGVAILTLLLATASAAFAEKRVALLIGNSKYDKVSPLKNPANDATRLAQKLTDMGFDKVTLQLDLAQTALRRTLGQFARDAAGADIALIYYAGHGIEVGGTNYIIPTDASLAHVDDVKFEAVELSKVVSSLNRAGTLKLVILDACRDNPFKASMASTGATRSIGRGLARVDPSGSDTLVVYAAEGGTIAEDGTDEHSPFARALMKHIATPGLDVRLMFGRVRDEVLKNTGRRQTPYTYGSLGAKRIFLKPGQSAGANASQAPNVQTSMEGIFWNSIQTSNDPLQFQEYLSRFPKGTFTGLAKNRIKSLKTKLALALPAKSSTKGAYQPVPVDIVDPVAVPFALTDLMASLRAAADKRDLETVRSFVGRRFFWDSDHGGGFDAALPPSVNFANALNLDPKNIKREFLRATWAAFKRHLFADTASRHKPGSNVLCVPGKGKLVDQAKAEKTAEKFNTDPWYGMMFALGTPVAVRSVPESDASIVGTIADEAVFLRHELRTDPDTDWEPVRMPSGVTGWARKERLLTFLESQLCFEKDAQERWKIVGYNAGGD